MDRAQFSGSGERGIDDAIIFSLWLLAEIEKVRTA
jgi:hypothetical protein